MWMVGVATVVLVALAAPAPVPPAAGADPAGPTVVEADAVRTYSIDPSGERVDPWVVWVCTVAPGGEVTERIPMTPGEVVDVLETQIAPYYAWLSEGAYRPSFSPGGTLAAGSVDGPGSCVADAIAAPASAGYAGAIVITDAPLGDIAFGDSGHKDSCSSPPCVGSDVLPGNGRSVLLGAQGIFATATSGDADFAETAHELGHTLDWGHAGSPLGYRDQETLAPYYVGPVDPDAPWIDEAFPGFVDLFDAIATEMGLPSVAEARAALPSDPLPCLSFPTPAVETICLLYTGLEYGDVTDVMATTPSPLSTSRSAIPATQSFNRYAAGWVTPDEVVTHDGGFEEVTLAPVGGEGKAMVVLPTDDAARFFTVEPLSPSPFSPAPELRPGAITTGVALHLVDQTPGACGSSACWGDVAWKTTIERGTPWAFGHVLQAGDVATVSGVRVEVTSLAADGTAVVRIGDQPPVAAPAARPVVAEARFTG